MLEPEQSALTPAEQAELERLEKWCRELEDTKGVTDTVHHDMLRKLREKAAAGSSTHVTRLPSVPGLTDTQEETDDTQS